MTTYFISDLHLQKSEPRILQIFLNFMENKAPKSDALYILGDLFETWVGDDDNSKFARKIISSLKTLSEKGTPIYFMCGNRDFAVGTDFAKNTGVTVLADPCVVTIYERDVLLMHGDLLCIDDVKYQAFRRKVYNPIFRKRLLSLPLFVRRIIAAWARYKSRKHTSTTTLSIQDVNQDEVKATMKKYGVDLLIHGHTHRPAFHHFKLDENTMHRIVLPAWHDAGFILEMKKTGEMEILTLSE